jgi:hypothetical protein
MIGTLSGEGPCPGAERAWRPASPQSSTMRSLKPLTTAAFCPKPGAQWTDGSEPVPDAVEVAEVALERGEDRERGQPRGLVGLIDREIATDEPLDKLRRSVERAVPGDIGKASVHLDQFEVPGRDERRRQTKSHLFELRLDPHRAAAQTGHCLNADQSLTASSFMGAPRSRNLAPAPLTRQASGLSVHSGQVGNLARPGGERPSAAGISITGRTNGRSVST